MKDSFPKKESHQRVNKKESKLTFYRYNKSMLKRIVLGILAHVDAGKTTLVENILFQTKVTKKLGRVDHHDSFLDDDQQERTRGITIYSKETFFSYQNSEFYLLDTPGHMDFVSEMERTLSVLDIAIILINGQDGVQSHTRTIWKMVEKHHIPTILFVNKMDISHFQKEELLQSIHQNLTISCLDWDGDQREEELILSSDFLLEVYEKRGSLDEESIQKGFQNRSFFPVLFGSALKGNGVVKLLELLNDLTQNKQYPETFGGIVYKVTSDMNGSLLTHVKLTGGSLRVKERIEPYGKIDQIRLYQGSSYEVIEEAKAGMIVTLKGLEKIKVGIGLGYEMNQSSPSIQACMIYRLLYPKNANLLALKTSLNRLSLEDPSLKVVIEEHQDIQIHLMGQLQKEILAKRIYELCQVEVTFDTGHIAYLETIKDTVNGVGHFEPPHHYAEVHLKLSPLKRGMGIQIENQISMDALPKPFLKDIVSILEEKNFYGVLTNACLTDLKISLIGAKGSLKLTKSGDFRQAVRRAIRQALMKAENLLLEPYLQFEIRIPQTFLSTVLFDLENRFAQVEVENMYNEWIRIQGKAPVSTMMDYQIVMLSSTKGLGRYEFELIGYDVCHHAQEVIREKNYDPELDIQNPSSSIFCTHKTSYTVKWDQVEEKMDLHLEKGNASISFHHPSIKIEEEELKRIFERANSNNRNQHKIMTKKMQEKKEKARVIPHLPKVLIVDGYNMIFSWQRFQMDGSLMVKREELVEVLFNYQAYIKEPILLVFDGYRVKESQGNRYQKENMTIIYTAESQTADAYIEKYVYEHHHEFDFEVASSDALIQNAVFANGAKRVSARELENRIELANNRLQELLERKL